MQFLELCDILTSFSYNLPLSRLNSLTLIHAHLPKHIFNVITQQLQFFYHPTPFFLDSTENSFMKNYSYHSHLSPSGIKRKTFYSECRIKNTICVSRAIIHEKKLWAHVLCEIFFLCLLIFLNRFLTILYESFYSYLFTVVINVKCRWMEYGITY